MVWTLPASWAPGVSVACDLDLFGRMQDMWVWVLMPYLRLSANAHGWSCSELIWEEAGLGFQIAELWHWHTAEGQFMTI